MSLKKINKNQIKTCYLEELNSFSGDIRENFPFVTKKSSFRVYSIIMASKTIMSLGSQITYTKKQYSQNDFVEEKKKSTCPKAALLWEVLLI